MRILSACLFALTAALAHPALARAADAPLPDPGWDAGRCGVLRIEAGHVAGGPGDRRIEGFGATLAPAGHPDAVAARLHADSLRTKEPASLDSLPLLFAGGLLVGVEADRPKGCDLTHAFRRSAEDAASLPADARAEQTWTGLRVSAGGVTYAAATFRLVAENAPGGVTHVTEDATELSSAGSDVAAEPIGHASIAVSVPHDRLAALAHGHDFGPDTVVTIDRLLLSSADTRIEAAGEVMPAARSGHLKVRAQNMEGIKAALPVADRDRAGAAMLIMRLAAKQERDGTLAWDVTWNRDDVTVNGVTLPFHF